MPNKLPLNTISQINAAIKYANQHGLSGSYAITGHTGLRLRIRPRQRANGYHGFALSTDFCHRYTHPVLGKRSQMTLGHYPVMSLAQAKHAYHDNLKLLAQGVDPICHRRQRKHLHSKSYQHTFANVAEQWLAHQLSDTKYAPKTSTLANWQRYLAPLLMAFADCPISQVSSGQVLSVCEQVQQTHTHTGRRIQSIAKRIFAYAVAHGMTTINPVQQWQGAGLLQTEVTCHHPALTTPNTFAYLLTDIDGIEETHGDKKQVLQLLALTFMRIGDVCRMRWADIDWQAQQWRFVPLKGRRRADMVAELIVPLAPQVLSILQDRYAQTGTYDYVFYHPRRCHDNHIDPKSINALLNSVQLNRAGIGVGYCGQGYKNVHTPHGFRASAKTLLMEQLGYDHLITELQSGRRMPDAYGNTYNRMQAIKARTAMMTRWADYLDEIKKRQLSS